MRGRATFIRMARRRCGALIAAAVVASGVPAALHAQRAPDSVATATLNDSGLMVRFPRAMSPDSITREMPVGDLFSGYEWRVVLLVGDQALLTALVLEPNDSLLLHRYTSIDALYMAGDLRQCWRDDQVLECDRLARGLVRDAGGSIEVGISDSRWITLALQAARPMVRLVVKRDRVILWSVDIPLAIQRR